MDLSRAEKFINRLPELKTPEAVGKAFSDMIRPFGFFGASGSELRRAPEGRVRDFVFVTWPAEWREDYENCGYPSHDPIPLLAWLNWRPFDLNDAFADCEKTEQRLAFEEWVTKLGVADVFAVPLHFPGGDVGLCVSVASRKLECPKERRALHFASIHALLRCRELIHAGGDSGVVKCPLSPRERECMRWVLHGKSDTDIGQILNISPTTVHYHIENVKTKLDVRTRLQAANVAISRGYI